MRTVAQLAGAIPVIMPILADVIEVEALLDRLDSLERTGAVSNMHLPRYGQELSRLMAAWDENARRELLGMPLLSEQARPMDRCGMRLPESIHAK